MSRVWERSAMRFARARHRIAHSAMVRRYRPSSDIPETYGAALTQRIGRTLDALTEEPAEFRVVEHERLDPLDSEHGTWRIAVEGRGRYEVAPGDMLYLARRNGKDDVEALLRRLGATGDERIAILTAGSMYRPGSYLSLTLREALRQHVEIDESSNAMLKRAGLVHMARHNEQEMAAHRRYHKRAGQGAQHPPYNPYHVYLPSLLDTSGARRITARHLVALQDRMHPRPYTLTGFRALDSDRFRAEITVSQVDKETHEPDGSTVLRPGRSSSFLSSLTPGETLSGWILPEVHHFPTSLGRTAPTIVICTGSGISGVMALLRAGYRGGPLWLIYGVRSWKHKHLYGPEIEAFRDSGDIARLDIATSRPEAGEGPARRVQQLIWDERKDVATWLRDGAQIYMSGRLSMGHEARAMIGRILVDGGMCSDEEHAGTTLGEWERTLRMQASVSGV